MFDTLKQKTYNTPMISCILLAAGASTRFGSPKALARLGAVTVIEHLQNTLIHSNIDEIIVVLGDRVDSIKLHILKHKKVRFVYNKDYNLGQTSSLQTGLRLALSQSRGFMVLPVDSPLVKSPTLNILIDEFCKKQPGILIPTFQGKKGHPPIFSARMKTDLLGLDFTCGLNAFEHQHEANVFLFAVEDEGIIKSFNTPQEFEAIKPYFKSYF